MIYWRGTLDLAIPEDVYNAIPTARKLAFRDEVRALKTLARRINEGQSNEEMTVKASWHWCTHEEPNPEPCVEQDI